MEQNLKTQRWDTGQVLGSYKKYYRTGVENVVYCACETNVFYKSEDGDKII